MYYIVSGKEASDGTYIYGIKDTKDGVVEYYSYEFIKNMKAKGIRIENVHLLDVSKSVAAKLALLVNKGFVFYYEPYCGVLCEYHGNEKSIVVPEGVNVLIDVDDCVEYVKLPSTLWSVSSGCFEYSQSIRGVEFPKTPFIIDSFAFYYCGNLEGVDLGGCLLVGTGAFKGTAINRIAGLGSVRVIGSEAFANCRNLVDVPVVDRSVDMARDSFNVVNIKG